MGVLNTTPMTFTSNNVLTAAQLNTEVRDALTNLQSAWTSYTPALTAASVNPTLGIGSSITGAYQQMGKTFWGNIRVTFGSSGVAAGTGRYALSLPVSANTSFLSIGHGIFTDSAPTTTYSLEGRLATATTFFMYLDNQTSGTFGLASNAPVVPAVNDSIDFFFFAQAA